MIWLLGVLLTMTASTDVPTAQKILVFRFPDGSRGGYGKIFGIGKIVYKDKYFSVAAEDTQGLLTKCGLRNHKLFDQITHQYYVYAPSAGNDLQIVECFKAKTTRHFDAGWGSVGRFGLPEINDDSAFRRFWRVKPASSSKQ